MSAVIHYATRVYRGTCGNGIIFRTEYIDGTDDGRERASVRIAFKPIFQSDGKIPSRDSEETAPAAII